MTLHLFRAGDSDIYAFTLDDTGDNLPRAQESDWRFLETLDPVRLAWENFREVCGALGVAGFYLFESELQPLSAQAPNTGRGTKRI
jgi:hypothetical protein